MGRRRAHRIAVVVPVTGSRALWGQLLQNAIARASSSSPPDAPAARWIVHDEAALTGPIPIGGPDSTGLTDDSYSAVFGHLDPGLLDSTLPHYAAADLPCFLPFTHPEHRPRPDLVLGWSSSPRAQADRLIPPSSPGTAAPPLFASVDGLPFAALAARLISRSAMSFSFGLPCTSGWSGNRTSSAP